MGVYGSVSTKIVPVSALSFPIWSISACSCGLVFGGRALKL